MIRDAEILSQLTDTIARFVRERLVPAEQQVAESDAIPDDIVANMKACSDCRFRKSLADSG